MLFDFQTCGKDEWKCSFQEDGEQCVMMAGMILMPVLCVNNWDFQLVVSYCAILIQLCYKEKYRLHKRYINLNI